MPPTRHVPARPPRAPPDPRLPRLVLRGHGPAQRGVARGLGVTCLLLGLPRLGRTFAGLLLRRRGPLCRIGLAHRRLGRLVKGLSRDGLRVACFLLGLFAACALLFRGAIAVCVSARADSAAACASRASAAAVADCAAASARTAAILDSTPAAESSPLIELASSAAACSSRSTSSQVWASCPGRPGACRSR